jgi:hypothetical protein
MNSDHVNPCSAFFEAIEIASLDCTPLWHPTRSVIDTRCAKLAYIHARAVTDNAFKM